MWLYCWCEYLCLSAQSQSCGFLCGLRVWALLPSLGAPAEFRRSHQRYSEGIHSRVILGTFGSQRSSWILEEPLDIISFMRVHCDTSDWRKAYRQIGVVFGKVFVQMQFPKPLCKMCLTSSLHAHAFPKMIRIPVLDHTRSLWVRVHLVCCSLLRVWLLDLPDLNREHWTVWNSTAEFFWTGTWQFWNQTWSYFFMSQNSKHCNVPSSGWLVGCLRFGTTLGHVVKIVFIIPRKEIM